MWQWSAPSVFGLCVGFRSTFQGLFLFFSVQAGFSVWCFSLGLGLGLRGGWSAICGMLRGITEGNNFGAYLCGACGVCCLLVRDGFAVADVGYGASAYPLCNGWNMAADGCSQFALLPFLSNES